MPSPRHKNKITTSSSGCSLIEITVCYYSERRYHRMSPQPTEEVAIRGAHMTAVSSSKYTKLPRYRPISFLFTAKPHSLKYTVDSTYSYDPTKRSISPRLSSILSSDHSTSRQHEAYLEHRHGDRPSLSPRSRCAFRRRHSQCQRWLVSVPLHLPPLTAVVDANQQGSCRPHQLRYSRC